MADEKQKTYFDSTQIKQTLAALFPNGAYFEFRSPGKGGQKTLSGIFNSFDSMQKALTAYAKASAWKYHGQSPWDARNFYITLNTIPVDIAEAMPQANKILEGPTAIGDNDIVRREWLMLDFDPKRRAELSSTDAEKAEALAVRDQVKDCLTALGFLEPICGDSGNGYHMLYKISLENTEENTALIENCLHALASMFDNDKVDIDQKVYNAARICKLYGTLAQKGTSTTARPHRMAHIISLPQNLAEPTPREALETLAAMAPKEPTPKQQPKDTRAGSLGGNTNGEKFNLQDFMRDHGLTYSRTTHRGNATIYFLDNCPFDNTHTNGDAKIFENDNGGAIGFKCEHNSCKGKSWQDVRDLFDPGIYDRKRQQEEAWRQRRQTTAAQVFDSMPPAENYSNADQSSADETPKPRTLEEYNAETATGPAYLEQLRKQIAINKATPALKTGFPTLDEKLNGGLRKDSMLALAAGTAGGKTALCVNIAQNIARQGQDVIYVSLETSKAQIVCRAIAAECFKASGKQGNLCTSFGNIENGITWYPKNATTAEIDEINRINKAGFDAYAAYGEHMRIPELIIGDFGANEVKLLIGEHYRLTGHVPVVVIDYLQLCVYSNSSLEDRRTDKQKLDALVFELKRISAGKFKKQGIPQSAIIVISSISKASYSDEANVGMFKESGAIEFTVSQALGLQYQGIDYASYVEYLKEWRGLHGIKQGGPSYEMYLRHVDTMQNKLNQETGAPKQLQLKILKNRTGPQGCEIALNYWPAFNYFEEPTEGQKTFSALTGHTGALDWEDEIQKDKRPKVITEGKDLPGGYFGAIMKFLTDYYGAQALAGIGFLDPHNGKDIHGTVTATGEKFTISATTKNAKAPWMITTKRDKKKAMPWGLDAVQAAQSLHALPDVPEPPQQTTLEGMGEDVTTEEAEEMF